MEKKKKKKKKKKQSKGHGPGCHHAMVQLLCAVFSSAKRPPPRVFVLVGSF